MKDSGDGLPTRGSDSRPSKTAQKRAQQALKTLGAALMELRESDLSKLGLDEALAGAIRDGRRIKSHGALRRQKQLIAKLLRNTDLAPLLTAVQGIGRGGDIDKRIFAQAERWRDRILSEGLAAIDDFGAEVGSDTDNLTGLFTELNRARSESTQRTARRRIFREVNSLLLARQQDGKLGS